MATTRHAHAVHLVVLLILEVCFVFSREVEANSSVRVKVDYVAGKEGVYDLKPFVVVDTITNQRYLLKHSPLIYVLATP